MVLLCRRWRNFVESLGSAEWCSCVKTLPTHARAASEFSAKSTRTTRRHPAAVQGRWESRYESPKSPRYVQNSSLLITSTGSQEIVTSVVFFVWRLFYYRSLPKKGVPFAERTPTTHARAHARGTLAMYGQFKAASPSARAYVRTTISWWGQFKVVVVLRYGTADHPYLPASRLYSQCYFLLFILSWPPRSVRFPSIR